MKEMSIDGLHREHVPDGTDDPEDPKWVQEQALELWRINTSLQEEIAERKLAEVALQKARDELETRVQERTLALSISNELLELEVAQRRTWEHELRQSETRHRTLLDAIPDAILKLDSQGTVIEYKPAFNDVLGLLASTPKGQTLHAVCDSSLADAIMQHVREALEAGSLLVCEYQLAASQELRDLEIRVQPNGVAEAFCIIRDVTERRKAERAKEEFLSIVSHELRTPMTSIAGALALVAAGTTGPLPDMAERMIAVANRNSERLIRLINDLLDLQKIETGTMPLNLMPVDMAPLIEQVLEANHAYAVRFGVELELKTPLCDVWIHADPDRIMQVLTNLVSNAVKFSPEGAAVDVSMVQGEDCVRISVQDQGPGISEAFRERVFQKFAQADGSSSRSQEGTGLGLSICKSIVEMHEGTIAFETSRGQGTTFYFDLPLLQSTSEDACLPHATCALMKAAGCA